MSRFTSTTTSSYFIDSSSIGLSTYSTDVFLTVNYKDGVSTVLSTVYYVATPLLYSTSETTTYWEGTEVSTYSTLQYCSYKFFDYFNCLLHTDSISNIVNN
ncbi:hypothetical protein DAHU10_020020 [Hanseniaspora uvarum]|nr:hypothetical protein DAHU10_020020 [Hanseniaspora uvarum]